MSALESATVHAVCVDDAGFRFYFSTQSRSTMTASSSTLSEDSLRPRALVLVHVQGAAANNLWDEARKRLLAPSLATEAPARRAPAPGRDATEIYSTTCGATFYSSGVLALAAERRPDADRFCLLPSTLGAVDRRP